MSRRPARRRHVLAVATLTAAAAAIYITYGLVRYRTSGIGPL